MGRRAEGWRVKPKRGWYYVHFTHDKVAHRIALGTQDSGEAARLAAKEYAAVVSGRRRQLSTRVGTLLSLDELLAEWISSLQGSLDEQTVATLQIYARKYIAFFGSMDHITEAASANYGRERLRKVMRKTVQKEMSYLRNFLEWCREQGAIAEAPRVPPLPKKATGKRSGKQRSTPVEITQAQALSIIAELPEFSKCIDDRKWPIRNRFRFAWESGLRPETVSRLRVPQNWSRGSTELRLDNDDDKARYGRVVPLTPAAVRMLEGAAPEEGVIFGHHNFNKALKAAAAKVLDTDSARRFASYDFRHGRVTHLLDEGASLTGAAYLVGHKQLTTTNRYAKPNRRAAERALEAVAEVAPYPPPANPPVTKPPKFSGDRRGSNPRQLEPQRSTKDEFVEKTGDSLGQEGPENDGAGPGFRTRCGNSDDPIFARVASEIGLVAVRVEVDGETVARSEAFGDDTIANVTEQLEARARKLLATRLPETTS